MSDWVGSFSVGDVRLPATFRGTARLLDGTETPTATRPARHDDLPGRFEAELDISFALLVGLGFEPVDPSHPAYPHYLAASAAPAQASPASSSSGMERHDPDAVVMPFETTVIVTAAMALRHGLVAPGRAGSSKGGTGPARSSVQPRPVPPPWQGGAGAGVDRTVPEPLAPGPRSAEAGMARAIPAAPVRSPGGAGRFGSDRMTNTDLNALRLGDAMRPRSLAYPGAPSNPVPVAAPEPATLEELPALAGATPSAGTGNQALDIVMTPGAPLPSAIRAVVSVPRGSRTGQGSAAASDRPVTM